MKCSKGANSVSMSWDEGNVFVLYKSCSLGVSDGNSLSESENAGFHAMVTQGKQPTLL